MASKSSRRTLLAPFARRTRPAKSNRLHCERLEDRTTPALFNVNTPLSFTGLNNNGCVATADFNHDGFTDAVLTNFGTDYLSGAGSTITVLYGKSGGGFNKVQLNTGGTNVTFASVADINGDGWDDLLVANANKQNTGSVSVFQNDGAGNLSLVGTPFSTASNNASWVGAADVTGDGVLDVIVASFGKDDGTGSNLVGNNVTIFQGNADAQGHGNFTYSSSPITTLAPEIQFIPTALAVADFNGDGFMDIAAVSPGVPADSGQPQPDGTIYLFQGTGSGGFSAPNLFDTAGALPVNVQAADVNGDGKKDLIIANAGDPNSATEFSNNSIGILLNVSTAASVNFGVPNSLTANCHGTFAVAVADFNMDGKQDIASINYGSLNTGTTNAFVSVYTGTGNGSFNTGSPGTYDLQATSPGGQYLAVGDVDNNGTPDLIAVGAFNMVTVLTNTSTANLATTTTLQSSANPSINGQSVTITATVSASSSVSGGTVTFFNNGTQIGSAVNLSSGQAAITVSNLTVGSHSITATYSGATGFNGSTSTPLSQVVNYAPATSLVFSGVPASATAGTAFNLTITAKDANNNLAGGYLGTVHFTSTDNLAGLPSDYTFVAGDTGAHTFSVTLKTVGSQTVTATDTVTGALNATTSGITVNPAAASVFSITTPANVTAGEAFNATVVAKDAFGNTATSYTGTVHFTSSDGQAVLPADYTFLAGDNGSHQVSVTLKTAGNQTITATDTVTSAITGGSSPISVAGAAASIYTVAAPSSVTVGSAFNVTVTAKDAFGNTASGYTGTVHFTSSDGAAVLPANYTFVAGDNGVHTFSVTLNGAGSQSITATDTVTGSITGNANTTVTSANPATHFSVSAPASATAGTSFSITVTALSAGNSTDTSYLGTVHFTSTDGAATLPANYTFTSADNGAHTFTVTLATGGSQTITSTDTATGSINGTTGGITVNAAAASLFVVTLPTNVTAGTAFNGTVTARDTFGNVVTGYTGTVHFTSSDGQGILPANYTFTGGDAGSHTFTFTLKTSGSQSITATDTVTSAITGNSATTVAAGAATSYSVSAPASAGLGAAFNVTIAAKDAFGNTATSYTGTVHFTSSDGAAVLPANYTFVAGDNGSHSFTVTMNTAGTQSITATDTVTGSINGTKNITIGGTSPPPSPQPFAVGSIPGMTATVTMYNPDHTVHFLSQPFGAGYTGGLRVAVGDVTGDGVADVVAVSNGGIPAKVKVINGATGLIASGNLLAGSAYTGKISVAVGDVDGDGKADIVIGTNEGGSPRVRVFHGGDFAKIKGFSAGPTAGFIGRTTVGVGDMNNDGKADIVVSALYTGRTRVAGFSGASIAAGMAPTSVFNKFALTGDYVSGLFLAVGDVNGDGRADLVVGSPQTKTSNVTVFSGKDLVDNNTRTTIASFTPPDSKKRTGEKVAVRDIDGDGTMEILTSSGEMVSAFEGSPGLSKSVPPTMLFSFDPAPTINGGVWVG